MARTQSQRHRRVISKFGPMYQPDPMERPHPSPWGRVRTPSHRPAPPPGTMEPRCWEGGGGGSRRRRYPGDRTTATPRCSSRRAETSRPTHPSLPPPQREDPVPSGRAMPGGTTGRPFFGAIVCTWTLLESGGAGSSGVSAGLTFPYEKKRRAAVAHGVQSRYASRRRLTQTE